MLKLIFSPYYDGNCYAGNSAEEQCVLGTKYVGPLGLLDELELRAGMSRGETSPMQRAIAYCNAIHQVLDSKPSPKPFYQQSFENDPLGVAQQLLRWRDALCMAGWDQNTLIPSTLSADGKNRLEDLQAIEEYFKSIGIGERWHQLLNADLATLLPEDLKIKVDMKMDLLPPVIRKVLEKTNRAQESEAVANLGDKTLSDFASKFTLYQFPEQNDAYQWAATQPEPTSYVFINEDNFTFNQVLKSVGEPLVAASIQGSVPEMSQLLKLGIALFRQPVNLTHLTSYLNIFRHPIQWQTRSDLRYKIQKDGGFKSVTDGKGNLISFTDPTINDTVSDPNLWGMWEKSYLHDNNVQTQTADVTAFCDALLTWLKKAKQVAAIELDNNPNLGVQLSSQLAVLENHTQALKAYLNGKTDISNDELDKVVASICQGDSIQTDYGRLGSCDILKDLKGLAVNGKTVIWMDCVRKPRPRYAYAFLNPADIKLLQAKDLLIPDASLEMQASDFAEKLAVSRAKTIIALMPQRKDGERTEENLIITELRALDPSTPINSGKKVKLPAKDTTSFTPKDIAPQEVEYKLRNNKLLENIDKPDPKATTDMPSSHTAGYQREHESYSSLSQLIDYPFDYLLGYIFNLKEDDSSNLSLIEGNVAHEVISKLVEKSTKNDIIDTNKFIALCKKKSGVKKLIEKTIKNRGVELLLPENQMEKNSFVRTLSQHSIPTLAKIIEENNLEVEGSEKEIIKTLKDSHGNPVFNLKSVIDLVLKKTEKGQPTKYYIFDFKWTTKPKDRKEELEECKELQLALYKRILEEVHSTGCVEMYGYYLLKQTKLLTTYPYMLSNAAIEVVKQKKSYNLFDQAVESYRERIKNLKDGFIEEGEDKLGPDFLDTQFIIACLSDFVANNPNKNFYLNNGLVMSTQNLGQMNSTNKKVSYNYAVLKNRIK
ncbi:MAG: PD-(D/E)XK nuclease family protein [Bacteroidales bacterium]|nr:PD-(D/E)XK nuclease family protein [Bacteroidales bacterium]